MAHIAGYTGPMATMDPPQAHVPLTDDRRERLHEMIGDELDAAWLYDRLAGMSEEQPARILQDMAESEREHAAHWVAAPR